MWTLFFAEKRNYISQISDPLIVALARSFVTGFQLHASPSSMETEVVWPLLSRVDATARAGVNLHACTYVRAVRCDRSDLRSRSQPVISHWALHGWRHGAVSSFNFCWRKIWTGSDRFFLGAHLRRRIYPASLLLTSLPSVQMWGRSIVVRHRRRPDLNRKLLNKLGAERSWYGEGHTASVCTENSCPVSFGLSGSDSNVRPLQREGFCLIL